MGLTDTRRYIFREVRENDSKKIYNLALSQNYHSDTLPQNLSLIKTCVKKSVLDFQLTRKGNRIQRPRYMFVLEDTADGSIVGTSQIADRPWRLLYRVILNLDILSQSTFSSSLELRKEEEIWELGGLLLSDSIRKKGYGKLISYGRLLYLWSMNIAPSNLLISGFNAALPSFWERVTKLGGIAKKDVPTCWRSMDTLYTVFFRALPASIAFDDLGLSFNSLEELLSTPIPIHPNAEAARRLLTRMGFVFLAEIEADGALWYGAPWQTVKNILRALMSIPELMLYDTCAPACHRDIAIVVLNTEEFHARIVPIEKVEDGYVVVSKRNLPLADIRHLFVF